MPAKAESVVRRRSKIGWVRFTVPDLSYRDEEVNGVFLNWREEFFWSKAAVKDFSGSRSSFVLEKNFTKKIAEILEFFLTLSSAVW